MARRSAPAESALPVDDQLPLVALIGRPNVGKSSLFNRLVGGRPALVEDMPGVTRDRRYGVCEWTGARFRVCDTGGLDPSAEGILGAMRSQTLRAVEEANLLVLVVDTKEGITPVDADVARVLRKTGKVVLLAANKVDPSSRREALSDVYALGFEDVFAISATHGRGIGELLDAVINRLGIELPKRPRRKRDLEREAEEEPEAALDHSSESTGAIRLAFVGKPNVGKSSLVNRLLGEERVLVHDQPGTTRDPIDTPFRVGDREFVLVDTAGLRRRRTVENYTEAVSAKMARDQLARADVAALVIDATQGATNEDARLASLIEESGRAAIIILNKGDLVPRSQIDAHVARTREELKFIGYAPLLVTSAKTGRGVVDLPQTALRVFAEWSRRVPTGELNRHFEAMVTRRPPPSGPSGRHVKMYYATQAATCPPTFFISTNQPTAVGYPYRRYLTNQLREIYGFAGSPLRVILRANSKKEKPKRPSR